MFKNIVYIFSKTNMRISKIAWGEFLHSLFLEAPTGILLFIIWELFEKNPDKQLIWSLIILITVLFIIQLWVARKVMENSYNIIYTVGSKLRLLLGNHLQKLSLGFYKKRDPGDLASVILQDIANFENIFTHTVQGIFGSICGPLILSIFLFILDWRLTIILLAAIPIALLAVHIATLIAEKYSERHIASRNETSSRFIEYIQGIRHLKAFNQTGNNFSVLEKAFDNLRKDSIAVEVVPGPFVITGFVFFELFFLIMIYVGMRQITATTVSIPTIIAFLIVGYRLYQPLKLVLVDYELLRYMNVSLNRIIDVLKAPLQDAGKKSIPQNYNIEFKNVKFAYVDRLILNDVSFSIPEKGLTALVGASGSGKTTIANLIARFWDVENGQISIGGKNLKDMAPQTIYSLISEVFQDVYLFDDTIYNNIKIGNPNASKSEILKVAEKAQIFEFLDKLPEGINTKVGESGSHLSGGQKQRISIARAMLKDAPIVLFDEATASLDPENEIYIQDAIQELVKAKTVVVIAHKLQTIRNADKIIVLKDGKISETGKHDRLIKKNGLYASYWHTQQSTSGWNLRCN